ncbi:CGNR zinc finger domain-containing protein [Kibdelosporangium phytohabitans]|uniref:Zinc finger CGNR domain-containing protein n=1 Tax=Kibdelosporangium phytohabitans TaxID=860235 RepID=A0A0N9HYC8_9PSEU|nr:ABATE domain-containing protein [Kibdelosporangium phytohabitans]ALG08331.1 hypothetical protein AOZ06_16705 [Kibdelosporangium phytohabitans]MBE1470636.1 putative RNA-binding Zn ribbon-like protein [Kibdelosporangium phytohabitans]
MRDRIPPLPSRDPPAANAAIEQGAQYFLWIAGDPVVDFVNTVRLRHRGGVELLRVPADLDAWLATTFGTTSRRSTQGDLATARSLREAVDLCLLAAAGHATVVPNALAHLNQHMEQAPLVWNGECFTRAPAATAAQALSRLAADAATLLEHRAHHIRLCDGPDCSLRLVDASRARPRRWCSMAACGNRTKAHRRRGRATQPGTG